MDDNNNSILRLYDEMIHVNAEGQHLHLLRPCEEKRRRKRRGKRGGKEEGRGEEKEKREKRKGITLGSNSLTFKSLQNCYLAMQC